ncbi:MULTISPECIES: hypothetical protein [Sulfurimonas]|uniref:hypothetical protein n=1 Tax=Sulfurimonas TaxID=202746 RepID=UPI00125F2B9A|nr:hypothetical protein [Sulfurimonas hydrogeniphila]
MGILTKNERDGLEDVFLSIHTSTNKYKKIKDLSALIMMPKTTLNFKKLLKQAKCGLKETKISDFLLKYTKKKKNLSK